MREIGEQWIEEGSDGKMHMYKAVEGENCTGCAFGKMCQSSRLNNIHVCDREDDCPLEYSNTVVKDLGPVNEDGLLACPFCRVYPKQISNGVEYMLDEEIPTFYVEHRCKTIQATEFCYSEQEAIDIWNRRV